MKYAIVVCATHNWLAPAAITLLSCAKHGAAEYADLLIVTPAPGPEQQAQLDKFNAKHGSAIKLINADIGDLAKVNAGRLSIGSLLRLRLDRVLARNTERVLYLDSDIIALSGCKELFEIDLEGFPLAATEDIAMLPWLEKDWQNHFSEIGIPSGVRYFNSGVLLFDWQKTLDTQLLSTAYEMILSGKTYRLFDQDVLNLTLVNNWKCIHPKWNLDKKIDGFLRIEPVFRHFTGSVKPWSCWQLGFSYYRKFARENLAGTDWEDFIRQKQQSILQSLNFIFLMRRLSFGKAKKLRQYLELS